MAASNRQFARLLTEGVKHISVREDKLLSVIQDQLGYVLGRSGRTAIEYWRRGHVPADPADVETLAREFATRGDLDRSWTESFLKSADYPNVEGLCNELYPPPPPAHLPSKPYRRLVGRDVLLRDTLTALHDPDGHWIVTIDGIGGIGKTALAWEIAERNKKARLFDALVWATAPRRESVGPDDAGEDVFSFDTALTEIGRQLGEPDIGKLGTAEKEKRVRMLLRRQRVLVVLDNLETAGEPQNRIVQRLQPLLGYSKALLTSRHRFSGEVYAIHLPGLDEQGIEQFVQQEATEKGIGRVAAVDSGQLGQIAESTGGCPLALKLVVGQLGHLPLDVVLEHLRRVQPLKSQTEDDDYVQFYRFILLPSWHLLSEDGEKLLISMANFVPGSGGTFAALQATSGLDGDALPRSIDELWRLSLLEVGDASKLGQIRYYLHALTQHFVLADVLEILDVEQPA